MFLFLFITSLLSITNAYNSEEKTKQAEQHHKLCVASSEVDKDLISNARKGEFKDDENLMAYYFCRMNKLGFQDEDGTLHPEVMIASIPEITDKERTIIEKCTKYQTVVCKELVAYKIARCFGKQVDLFK